VAWVLVSKAHFIARCLLMTQGVGSGTSITAPLRYDGTLFYHTTDTYTINGDSETPLDQAKSALQIFIMSFEYGPGPRGGESNATVLCRIVDKSANSPDSTNLPQSSDTPSSGAVVGCSMVLLWGIAMLSALAIS
jgi:hypothetical protein